MKTLCWALDVDEEDDKMKSLHVTKMVLLTSPNATINKTLNIVNFRSLIRLSYSYMNIRSLPSLFEENNIGCVIRKMGQIRWTGTCLMFVIQDREELKILKCLVFIVSRIE